MRLDHVSYAAEKDGARATADRLAAALGVRAVNGGVHPSFGTRNVILPMAHGRYVEVVEVLDHPVCDKAPFGQAVRRNALPEEVFGDAAVGQPLKQICRHAVEAHGQGRGSVGHQPPVWLMWRDMRPSTV